MGLCAVEPNCTLWSVGRDDRKYHADPDIAGIGVIFAFITTSLVTIIIANGSFFLGLLRGYEGNSIDVWIVTQIQKVPPLRKRKLRTNFWQPVVEELVMTLSNQQIVVGVAILITGFLKHCSISVYHFSIVADLAWFSSNTHLTSLNVLQVYLEERPRVRDWRVGLMVTILCGMLAAHIMEGHQAWYSSWNSPAQCLFDDLPGNVGGEPGKSMFINLFLLVFGYTTAIARLYRSTWLDEMLYNRPVDKMSKACTRLKDKRTVMRTKGRLQTFIALTLIFPEEKIVSSTKKVFVVFVTVLSSLTANFILDIVWFALGLVDIIDDRNIDPEETDGNENAWGFGQIVPVLLLFSIVLTFKELYERQQEREREQGLTLLRARKDQPPYKPSLDGLIQKQVAMET
ncbi:MAG: hypothetical protein Q9174_003261 [Haloplaca sp. 1 TL-2023]